MEGYIINNNCFNILPTLKTEIIDLIVTDPPYFLSNGGLTIKNGKITNVDKNKWDKLKTIKENGTIWISGTMHNIYSIGMALKESGFKIINNITWKKLNPPPNISYWAFTNSTESILRAKK